jgi:hypothetical protein
MAGEDGGVGLAQLRQLASEYGCPRADPPVELSDGGELQSAARVARNACIESRSAAEVFRWRDFAADGGFPAAPPADHATLHLVSGLVVTVGASFSAYANNRTARHLGLWP